MKEGSLKRLLQPYLSTPAPLPILKIYDKSPKATIGGLLASMQQCNQDILYHIQGILLYPHLDRGLSDEFPYFGDRLRPLTLMLQHHRPRTLKEFWMDSRDTMQRWTFWLVLIVGIPSLLLALTSLVLGGVQTWSEFERRCMRNGDDGIQAPESAVHNYEISSFQSKTAISNQRYSVRSNACNSQPVRVKDPLTGWLTNFSP